jgi:Flp pilus assembly protein TadG
VHISQCAVGGSAVLPFFAIVLPVMILFCGLVLDMGILQLKTLQMQTAADAAAVAAELEAERGTGNWVSQGTADAAINGFTNGSNSVSVTLSQLPTYGPYAGRYDTLQASITQQVSTIFMGALNGGSVTLRAQAAALMTPCVYLTGTGALQSYTLDIYSGSFDGNTCPVDINTSARVQSNANTATVEMNIAGASSSSSMSGFVYPAPQYNVPSIADPLAAKASPSFNGTCNHTSYSLSGGTATLNPGNYCKGMTLTQSTVALNPGLYVITGGATWNNSTVSGSGVTLFFTQGGGASYSKFIIENTSTVTISAPGDNSNGAIPGILVFADRHWVPTDAQDFALENSSIQGDGIWYLPGAGLYFSTCGTFTSPHYLGIVADNIYSGGTIINVMNNYSYLAGGNPFRLQGGLVQ